MYLQHGVLSCHHAYLLTLLCNQCTSIKKQLALFPGIVRLHKISSKLMSLEKPFCSKHLTPAVVMNNCCAMTRAPTPARWIVVDCSGSMTGTSTPARWVVMNVAMSRTTSRTPWVVGHPLRVILLLRLWLGRGFTFYLQQFHGLLLSLAVRNVQELEVEQEGTNGSQEQATPTATKLESYTSYTFRSQETILFHGCCQAFFLFALLGCHQPWNYQNCQQSKHHLLERFSQERPALMLLSH